MKVPGTILPDMELWKVADGAVTATLGAGAELSRSDLHHVPGCGRAVAHTTVPSALPNA